VTSSEGTYLLLDTDDGNKSGPGVSSFSLTPEPTLIIIHGMPKAIVSLRRPSGDRWWTKACSGPSPIEALEPAIRSSEPGRYHVDEISADPLRSGHTSTRWGVGIKRPVGSVELETDPWPGALAIGRPLSSLILNGST
jgi:hypothetical protein